MWTGDSVVAFGQDYQKHHRVLVRVVVEGEFGVQELELGCHTDHTAPAVCLAVQVPGPGTFVGSDPYQAGQVVHAFQVAQAFQVALASLAVPAALPSFLAVGLASASCFVDLACPSFVDLVASPSCQAVAFPSFLVVLASLEIVLAFERLPFPSSGPFYSSVPAALPSLQRRDPPQLLVPRQLLTWNLHEVVQELELLLALLSQKTFHPCSYALLIQ
mmetsp:Transcript_142220/g.201241  ORF Transcript_142220/g.201241 Transcript_142220/m.201241 type:complete len:217 (-) Transcript_142220:839-1489(-)